MYLFKIFVENVLRDAQLAPPVGECARCNGELYGGEETFCSDCLKELNRYDPATVEAVMSEMDRELKQYLSDDLRNDVWNALCKRFPVNV